MKIYILNTTKSGTNIIKILKKKIRISGIIGLYKKNNFKNISDYLNQKNFCKFNNINYTEVKSYSLNNISDINKITKLKIDILIVLGWQRLIPDWLIDHCKIFPIGSHGSPAGITKGRGRSPQNWSIILGLKKFIISIFKIDNNVDSGDVIKSKTFKISTYDNIQTSYYKCSILIASMIIDLLKRKTLKGIKFKKQINNKAEYFPKREPNDGLIDWNRKNDDIYNFIRGLTKPYPGAFSYIKKDKIIIWDAIPFDLKINNKLKPGTLFTIFYNKDFLVKTKDGFILIKSFEIEKKNLAILKDGAKFKKVIFRKQIKKILNKHKKKNSNFKISKYLLNI